MECFTGTDLPLFIRRTKRETLLTNHSQQINQRSDQTDPATNNDLV